LMKGSEMQWIEKCPTCGRMNVVDACDENEWGELLCHRCRSVVVVPTFRPALLSVLSSIGKMPPGAMPQRPGTDTFEDLDNDPRF